MFRLLLLFLPQTNVGTCSQDGSTGSVGPSPRSIDLAARTVFRNAHLTGLAFYILSFSTPSSPHLLSSSPTPSFGRQTTNLVQRVNSYILSQVATLPGLTAGLPSWPVLYPLIPSFFLQGLVLSRIQAPCATSNPDPYFLPVTKINFSHVTALLSPA